MFRQLYDGTFDISSQCTIEFNWCEINEHFFCTHSVFNFNVIAKCVKIENGKLLYNLCFSLLSSFFVLPATITTFPLDACGFYRNQQIKHLLIRRWHMEWRMLNAHTQMIRQLKSFVFEFAWLCAEMQIWQIIAIWSGGMRQR